MSLDSLAEWLFQRVRHVTKALPVLTLAALPTILQADTRVVKGVLVQIAPAEDSAYNPVDTITPRSFACTASGVTPDGASFNQSFISSILDGSYEVRIPATATMVTMECLGNSYVPGDKVHSNVKRTLPLPSDGSAANFTFGIPEDMVDDSNPQNMISAFGAGLVVGTEPFHALDDFQATAQNAPWSGFGGGPTNLCIPTPNGPQFLVVDDPTVHPGSARYARGDLRGSRWPTTPVPVFANLASAPILDGDAQAAQHAMVNGWNIGNKKYYIETSQDPRQTGYGIFFDYTQGGDYQPLQSDGKMCGAQQLLGSVQILVGPWGANATALGAGSEHELGHGLAKIHTPPNVVNGVEDDTLIMNANLFETVSNTWEANGRRANRVQRYANQILYDMPLKVGTVDGVDYYTNALSYSNPGEDTPVLDPTYNPMLCTYRLTPIRDTFPAPGGTGTIRIDTASYCQWSASDPVTWTTPTGATSGKGPGTFTFQVAPNTGATRTGTLTIAGTTIKIVELGDSVTGGLYFVPVTPCRVEDTRNGNGPYGGPALQGGDTRIFNIPQSGCNIPFTAKAYSFNATIVPVSQGPVGFVTLWPAGQAQPNASTLNSWDGRVVANAAIIQAGTNGEVSVYSSHPTDVILDVNGYFDTLSTTTAYSFYPVTPCRVADTRWPVGIFGGPALADDETRDFPIANSSCGIPPEATAGSFNFTVVPSGYLGYLSTWPTGEDQPNVSTLNSWDGRVVANAGIVPMGTNGINMFATNQTHAIIDTNGYFALPGSPGALLFHPMTPCRVEDTRNPDGPFGGPILKGGTARSFAIPASGCNVPNTAAAYIFNLTLAPTQYLGYATVAPTGPPLPYVSTDNSWTGTVVANMAIVPAGINGSIDLYVTQDTHAILDITGYFALE